MKLDIKKAHLETSENIKGSLFSISDMSFIFDILRSKIYSNPIESICREYSCNARDAHIEINNGSRPIEINFPSTLDPNWKCKDYGPGISPSRMEDVFIKYAASTKRNDNNLVGGYGLGCKTAYSYTDSFSIETIVDGIKYFYTASIDETRAGKMFKVDEQPTTEPNGTTIIVPVKKDDFQTFINATIKTTEYWNVKPILKGTHPLPEYTTFKDKILFCSGKDWDIYHPDIKRLKYTNYDIDRALILIAGIPYNFSAIDLGIKFERHYTSSISNENRINSLIKNYLIINMPIGSISLSSSRETIHFDEKTKKVIKNKLIEILNDLKEKLLEKIKNSKTLTEAEITYDCCKVIFENIISMPQSTTWGNVTLKGTSRHIGNIKELYSSSPICATYSTNFRTNKLRRVNSQSFYIKNEDAIYVNDLKKSNQKHKTGILQNLITKYEYVHLISFPVDDNGKTEKIFNEKLDFNLLDIHYLSNEPIPEKIEKVKKVASVKSTTINVLKYNEGYWDEVSLDKTVQHKGCYVTLELQAKRRRGRGLVTWSSKNMLQGHDSLSTTSKVLKKDIYAIKEKDIKHLNGLTDLYSELKKYLDKNSTHIKNYTFPSSLQEHTFQNIFNHLNKPDSNWDSCINNPESLMKRYMLKSLEITKNYKQNEHLIKIAAILQLLNTEANLDNEIIDLKNKVKTTYPLLLIINDYLDKSYYGTMTVLPSDWVNYINDRDQAMEKEMNQFMITNIIL